MAFGEVDRQVDDAPVEPGAVAEAVGDVEERRRGDDLAVLALHPHQDLVEGRSPVVEVHDRLGVERKAVALERSVQALRPDETVGEMTALGPGLLVDDRTVAALVLGVVHRHVCGHQRRLLGGDGRIHGRDAGGQRDVDGRVRNVQRCRGDGAAQLLGDGLGRLGRHVVEQHRELVTAQSRERIGVPQPRAQRVRNVDDQRVAGLVSQCVVDVLEPIQVEGHQRPGDAVAPGSRRMTLQLLGESPTVPQAGERVVVGEVHEVRLALLALGDVDDLRDEVLGLTCRHRARARPTAAPRAARPRR